MATCIPLHESNQGGGHRGGQEETVEKLESVTASPPPRPIFFLSLFLYFHTFFHIIIFYWNNNSPKRGKQKIENQNNKSVQLKRVWIPPPPQPPPLIADVAHNSSTVWMLSVRSPAGCDWAVMAKEPWLLSDHNPAFKSKIQQSGTEKKYQLLNVLKLKRTSVFVISVWGKVSKQSPSA